MVETHMAGVAMDRSGQAAVNHNISAENRTRFTGNIQTHDTGASLQKGGALGTHKSIQLVDTFEFPFLQFKSVMGTRPPAAVPAPAGPLGIPTNGALGWPVQTGQGANRSGGDDGDIVLGHISGAMIARRDDAGSSERGGRQESKNGDLHGSGRPRSKSAMVVGTGSSTVPGWEVRR
jgi:hypothetical protein